MQLQTRSQSLFQQPLRANSGLEYLKNLPGNFAYQGQYRQWQEIEVNETDSKWKYPRRYPKSRSTAGRYRRWVLIEWFQDFVPSNTVNVDDIRKTPKPKKQGRAPSKKLLSRYPRSRGTADRCWRGETISRFSRHKGSWDSVFWTRWMSILTEPQCTTPGTSTNSKTKNTPKIFKVPGTAGRNPYLGIPENQKRGESPNLAG